MEYAGGTGHAGGQAAKPLVAVALHCLCLQCATRPACPPAALHQVNLKYDGGCSKGELTLVGQEQAREFGERGRNGMMRVS